MNSPSKSGEAMSLCPETLNKDESLVSVYNHPTINVEMDVNKSTFGASAMHSDFPEDTENDSVSIRIQVHIFKLFWV